MTPVAFLDDKYPVRTFISDFGDTKDYDNWKSVSIRAPVIKKFLGVDFDESFYGQESHSGNVFVINQKNEGMNGKLEYINETYAVGDAGGYDSIVTSLKKVMICIWSADCVPVFLYDPVKQVIAVAHNGWRGILADITINTLNVMERCFGTKHADVIAAYGPGICGNCYEVGTDIYDIFLGKFEKNVTSGFFRKKDNGKFLLDLKKAATYELTAAGVQKENIFDTGICSYENKSYASYRRDGKSGPAMQTISGIVMY
ncbi:polyphenol oxidase family protein [Butyrivibrio sp. WCE2006]|uniref:polyphenol oxidase family protein n=1 Tax=Butyrivibrio sp. WCE2006 TaxID=1410611 RepID=UPI0005D1FAB3|nr:polyphenol oxidase family protein [Butyrivibrio sp. WCE2006]